MKRSAILIIFLSLLMCTAVDILAAPPEIVTIEGAGQRLHFSFGGQLALKLNNNKLQGEFWIVLHPLSPPGSSLSASCEYDRFDDAVLSDDTIEFDAYGYCRRFRLDGAVEEIGLATHIIIVDGGLVGGLDGFGASLIGSTGIGVPGGSLEFGDFSIVQP